MHTFDLITMVLIGLWLFVPAAFVAVLFYELLTQDDQNVKDFEYWKHQEDEFEEFERKKSVQSDTKKAA